MAAPNNQTVTVWYPPPKQTLLIPLAAVYTHMCLNGWSCSPDILSLIISMSLGPPRTERQWVNILSVFKTNDTPCWSVHIFSLDILSGTMYEINYILRTKTRKKPLIFERNVPLPLEEWQWGAQRVFSDSWGGFCFRQSEVLFLHFQRQRESKRHMVRQDVVHDGGGLNLPCCGYTPPHLLSSCCRLGGCFHLLILPSALQFIYIYIYIHIHSS